MRGKLRLGLAAAAALCLGSAAVAIAETVDTKVTLKFDPRDNGDYFEGKVKASAPECVEGRKVVVKYLDKSEVVGSDKTDAGGTYEVAVDGAAESGTYKAIAKKKSAGEDVCAKATDTLEEEHDG